MSGLVTGLQNRAQRFESASDLQLASHHEMLFLLFPVRLWIKHILFIFKSLKRLMLWIILYKKNEWISLLINNILLIL